MTELRLRELSSETVKSYRVTFGRLDGLTLRMLEDSDALRDFVLDKTDGLAVSTRSKVLAHLRTFQKWLFERGEIVRIVRIPLKRGKVRRDRRPLGDDEVLAAAELLRSGCGVDDVRRRYRAMRSLVLFGLLYSTGMRIGEAVGLRVDDFDFGQGTVFIRGNKTSPDRLGVLSDEVIQDVRAFISVFEVGLRDVLWRLPYGKRQNVSLHQLAESLRESIGITPHSLRHKFIFERICEGRSAFEIMALVGHSTPTETMHYFNQARRYFPFAKIREEIGLLAHRAQTVKRPRNFNMIQDVNFSDEQLRQIRDLIDSGVISKR